MPRKNPRRNISRIEVRAADDQRYGGWQVRIRRRGRKTEKYFADNAYGGKRGALQAAKAFRDDLERSSRHYLVKELARTPSRRNRSGVVGVRLHRQRDARGEYEYLYSYWVAQWTDGHGRRRTRSFSIHHYGDRQAFELACAARRAGVQQAGR
jgi:hypothetical protein